ncbi:hypothetical protein RFI_38333, partial [Reticulomyxa filosa]
SDSSTLNKTKLLHSSPPQIVPIHQMMLFMHCLDACKADTDSSFLSSQLRTCHKLLVDSFKPWLISWIHFDKDENYAYVMFDGVMKSHLPNFQYVLHHPDIHLCIIDQIQTQFNIFNDERLVKDRLELLQYLCISTETSDVVVQCCKQVFKRGALTCANLICVISVKLNEKQLDD